MIRDPGPIHSLGFSVTSRDIPTNEGETQGTAPNSGYVSRALDEHPIMRFFASTGATMVAAMAASKLVRGGGLRLAKTIQDSANTAGKENYATSIVKSVTDIRKHLDELQGIKRYVDGVEDPYSEIVFLQDGRLTTGYDGIKNERFGYDFLTGQERRLAGSGTGSEPTVMWAARDQMQQRLVRAGRRLPYELPAMYAVQRGVTDTLFGERDQSDRKVKWYNPADVVSDFVTQSVKNVATMILPFEMAGAAASNARSSLHSLRYSNNDFRRLTGFQKKMHKGFVDVNEVLSEVGHDFAKLTDRFLKTSAQTSGALSTAGQAYKNNQQGFVQTLNDLRKGRQAAADAARRRGASERAIKAVQFKTAITGKVGQDSYASVFELIPTFRGIRASAEAGKQEFRKLGKAYDAMDNSIAFNRVLASSRGMFADAADLSASINKIQGQHKSRFSRLAGDLRILGAGGPDDRSFSISDFSMGQKRDAFKDLLESNLISSGVAQSDARQFVSYLNIQVAKSGTSATNIVTIGKTQIIGEGTDDLTVADDFFDTILKRYRGIKNGAAVEQALGPDASNVFRRSVEDARATYVSSEFQKGLKNNIAQNWNKFQRDDLSAVASTIMKPQKAVYQDFVGVHNLTAAKQEFLQRKVAETVGIKLLKPNGQRNSERIINNELRNRGFDPTNFGDLRSFLIKNRKMTSGVMGGQFNLFGLRSVTVDEARSRGVFSELRDDEQRIINDLAARQAINDPISKSIGLSKVDGLYATKHGKLLDFSSVKSTFSRLGNFFASEFKIPILGFNPADLFGYRSFAEMSRRSSVQYVSGRDAQPFLPKGTESRADFYIWHRTGGTKGNLTGFFRDTESGAVFSSTMNGTYRGVPTNSIDLLSRSARNAADMDGETISDIRGQSGSRFLNKVLGNNERALRFKRAMSFESDQPNSLFGFASRFARRGSDPNNPAVMAKLLRGEKVKYGNTNIRLSDADGGALKVIDDAGNVVNEIGEDAIIAGYNSLRRNSFQYGLPTQVIRELEEIDPDNFTMLGRRLSEMTTEKQLVDFAEEILGQQRTVAAQLRQAGYDPKYGLTASSRIRSVLRNSNLSSVSPGYQRSPTIITRMDELKNEIFRYISEVNPAIRGVDPGQALVQIQRATDDLVARGIISSSQRIEAQAAGLSTLFNMSAFRTYSSANNPTANARAAVAQLRTYVGSVPESHKLFDPFTKGEISQVSGLVRRRFSPILSPLTRKFGMAPHEIDELTVDPLGAGGGVTMVPTFGTVFGRDPMGAIKNALGFNTYRSPETYSTGSVPIQHSVERLNRYFGTLGMQLDVSDFNGPLDLFARGMVGKRVLPMYAAGTTFMTVDRTLGGMMAGEDLRGETIYTPFITEKVARGVVELQSLAAGITPGGMSYEEKREQLVEGEVPIRQGRFWPLGNTPFEGGKIMYYRPSWYRKLQGGAAFTSDNYGSPMEKFLFYNDISPLRPFDPYRYERKHYEDRPYPVTGEYFSGPFGPLVPLANATIGKILKPQLRMHEEETAAGLANYVRAGEFGAFDTSAYTQMAAGLGYGAGIGVNVAPSLGAVGVPGGSGGDGQIAQSNARLAASAGPTNLVQGMVRGDISTVNQQYLAASYGPPKVSGVMQPSIVAAGAPVAPSNLSFQSGEIGYRVQEMAGIYGFAFASVRESLGFGQGDFEPQRAVLQSASKAYGTSRAFWDLNLGGLGDVPLPSREAIGNIEFSEIVRRFIPKERKNIDYINPIRNTMADQYPFLPGAEYFTNFQTGDPFSKVQEGELRLPGVAYERFNPLFGGGPGAYGPVNQLDILADVAPYSRQFKDLNRRIDSMISSPEERIKVEEVRSQVEDTTRRYDFAPYEGIDTSGMPPTLANVARVGEFIAHSDNFIIQKFAGRRTATEDWERRNVYGATFPEWSRPFEGYIKPMINKATQENPIIAGASLAAVGALFGSTPRARVFGSGIGLIAGTSASVVGNVTEAVTGDRFIPLERKKELALEEYTDILNYMKNTKLASEAQAAGDARAAVQYRMAAGRTMYGADIYSGDIDTLSLAVPKRKREHFREMIGVQDQGERERILSTAGRLERRIYQAAWGMKVEKRPELQEYFSRHELPDASWEGWHPNTNLDHVKIKMGQSMGLEMSEMGYYPQQIRQANLANPSYPEIFGAQSNQGVADRLRRLMSSMGLSGSINSVMTPFGSDQIDVSAGVR